MKSRPGAGFLIRLACCCCCCWLLFLCQPVDARRTKGKFQLSGVNTEHVLSSFVIAAEGGRVTVRLGTDDVYDDEDHLKFRVYRDDVWSQFQKATLCTEKIKLAEQTTNLKFLHVGENKRKDSVGSWEAIKTLQVADPNVPAETIDQPHYYYFVVDDCSLEKYMHDNSIPNLQFEINTWNYYKSPRGRRRTTQMGYDEEWLMEVHELTLLASFFILFWLGTILLARLVRKKTHNTVHASLLWIAIAAGLDMMSSVCQLIHLDMYYYNGEGSSFMDAMSTHLSSMCDALLMLFLLSIGAGWTLPSDMVNIQQGGFQSVVADMASPLSALLKLSKTGIAGVSFLGLNAILAQWGRTYDDDFDTYHEYSHFPGHVRIFLRITLGLAFLGTTLQTRLHCRVTQLQTFYRVLAFIGFFWFEAMPLVTFTCNWILPFHLRHPAVYLASAILQSSSLVLLSWLVTSHATSYHQYSHMANNEQPTLSETLSTPTSAGTREWKIFGKAKVRLD